MNLTEKYYVQNSIVSMINQFMTQNGVSAMDMLNIIESIGSQLKDVMIQELLRQQQAQQSIQEEVKDNGDTDEELS